MPIIRGAHDFEENFTRVPNRWLRDQRLSLKAIGLLAQLHSHSIGWRVSMRSLAEANQCGLDQIRSAITELEQAGYLKREQARGENNQFAESLWTTTDPLSGFPLSGFPNSDNPTPKKNKVKKNNEKKDMLIRFDEFWQTYPRKVGKNTAVRAYEAARARFDPLSGDFETLVISGAARLAQDPNLPPMQYVPYPTTWLNRDGWNDDPYPARKLTPEEVADKVNVQRSQKREKEITATRKLLAETPIVSTPIPLCEHGNKLLYCRTCAKNLATGE